MVYGKGVELEWLKMGCCILRLCCGAFGAMLKAVKHGLKVSFYPVKSIVSAITNASSLGNKLPHLCFILQNTLLYGYI